MAAKQDVWRAIPALMGDGNGTIEVPNQANMVYIRVGDGDLGQAFNNRCQLRDNLAIYVGYDPVTDPDRRIFQVLSVRMADYAGAGNTTVPNVGPHHTTHEFGGGDDTFIDWRRLMGLRVGRPAAFVVTVDPGYIYRAGWIAIPSTNVDLTAEHAALVGTQAQYTLISLSSVGAVTHTNGTPVISPAALTIADVPVPPAGHIPLAAVRLYKVQTAIGDTPAAPDIIDLRFPTYNSTAASGVAGGLDTQVQYNSGGVLAGDAGFTYVPDNPSVGIAASAAHRGSIDFPTYQNDADFSIVTSYAMAGGFINDTIAWGFNTKSTPGVCALNLAMESRYWDGSRFVVEHMLAFNSSTGYATRPMFFAAAPTNAANQAALDMMWWWTIGETGNSKFLWSLATTGSLMQLDPNGTIKFFDPTDVAATHFGQYAFTYTLGTDTSLMTYGIGGPATNNGIYIPRKVGIGVLPEWPTNTILNVGGDIHLAAAANLLLGTYGTLTPVADAAGLYHTALSHTGNEDIIFQVGRLPNGDDCAIQLPRNSADTELLRLTASQNGGGIIGANGYYIDAIAPSSSMQDINFRFINTGGGAFTRVPFIVGSSFSHFDCPGVGTSVYIPHDYQNIGLCGIWWGTVNVFGGGRGVVSILNCTIAPTTYPTGGGVLYSQAGVLKWYSSVTTAGAILMGSGMQTIVNTSAGATATQLVLQNSSNSDGTESVLEFVSLASYTPTGRVANTRVAAGDYSLTLGHYNYMSAVIIRNGNLLLGTSTDGMTAAGSLAIEKDLAHRGTKVGFYNGTPVVRGAALTAQLTTITHTAPGTPDYAIQDFAQNGGAGIWGFADHDEANTVLSVIANLQTRVAELEARLGSATGVNLFA